MSETVIETSGLCKWFREENGFIDTLLGREGAPIKAVNDVTLEINEGEIVGLVGESGCGKSTLGETILHLHKPTKGTVSYRGEVIGDLSDDRLKELRKDIQIIYQNPYETLNPRLSVKSNLLEPLRIHDIGTSSTREEKIQEVIESVGLEPANVLSRFPDQLSGGQRQRVSIARTLVLDPEFIVADEPVSMLDVSVQSEVLKILRRSVDEFGLSMLYISHNLSTVAYLCDYVNVMYLGEIIESGPTEEIINNPKHPYTQSLISAIPSMDPREERTRTIIEEQPEESVARTPGCNFAPRCSEAMEHCHTTDPENYDIDESHQTKCFLYE